MSIQPGWKELRSAICKLDAEGESGFEGFVRDLFQAEIGCLFYLARKGDQPTGDANSPRGGIALKAKRYNQASVSEDKIEGEIDRAIRGEPARTAVTDHLVVGRRLLRSEICETFDNYVDLTAEFIEPSAIRCSPGYCSFPILDGSAPTVEALHAVVNSLRPGRTFVHCAQGHGRTGLFALAVLLSSGAAKAAEDGLQLLRAARPGIRLNRIQRQCIWNYARHYAKPPMR